MNFGQSGRLAVMELTLMPTILTASSGPKFPKTMNSLKFDAQRLRSRYVLRRLWVPAFMMTGISLLSGTAGPQVGSWSFVGIDKVGHFVVFGLIGIAWCRSLQADAPAWRRLLLATGLTTCFGLLDELHQFHNPERFFEWADLLADAGGALFSGAAYLYIKPLQSLLELEFRQCLRLRFQRTRPELAG